MNEEQLADLLIEHLDAFLGGEPLPEAVPDEVAELLAVAHSLFETAPSPRPEFGPTLKESLMGPTSGGNGAAPGPGSTFSSPTLFVGIIGLLVTAAGLALLASLTIFSTAQSDLLESLPPTALPNPTRTLAAPTLISPAESPWPTAPPSQTQIAPAQSTPVIQIPSVLTPTMPAIQSTLSAEPVTLPTPTPIIDVLPAVTITVEIRIAPPDLVPGSNGGNSGGGGGSGAGGGSGGDGGSSGGGGGGSGGGGSGGGGSSGGGGGDNDDDGGDGDD